MLVKVLKRLRILIPVADCEHEKVECGAYILEKGVNEVPDNIFSKMQKTALDIFERGGEIEVSKTKKAKKVITPKAEKVEAPKPKKVVDDEALPEIKA